MAPRNGMSAKILSFPAQSERDRDAVVTTHPFGGCPGCGNADGYLNDERGHRVMRGRWACRGEVAPQQAEGGLRGVMQHFEGNRYPERNPLELVRSETAGTCHLLGEIH